MLGSVIVRWNEGKRCPQKALLMGFEVFVYFELLQAYAETWI